MKNIIASDEELSFQNARAETKSIKELYIYWQNRILITVTFGYACFYWVRMNFSMAMPSMIEELGYTKTDLGLIISIWSIIYGVGKFMNGYFSDRSNARYFMSIGLLGAALTSLFMSWGTSWWFFAVVWAFNAWFQSMGWPPIAKLLTHWFSPQQLGTRWGIANLSHQIGGAAIVVFAGYLIKYYSWETAFWLPAVIVLAMTGILFLSLRDTPHSLGLPSIEVHENLIKPDKEESDDNLSTKEVIQRIFCNKLLWLVCLGNMFLYIVRMGVFNWAPTFLKEAKGATLEASGWQVAFFEIAGMLGGIAAGWASDQIFKGRRGPVSCIWMIGIIICLFCFWFIPAGQSTLNAIIMMFIGFFVYGPQVLVGVAAADFASKKAVGMAVGLTGTFGYVGSAISGYGVGKIADVYGWSGGFAFFTVSAILGTICFALTWNRRSATLEKS